MLCKKADDLIRLLKHPLYKRWVSDQQSYARLRINIEQVNIAQDSY